jgi:hypothetical protein
MELAAISTRTRAAFSVPAMVVASAIATIVLAAVVALSLYSGSAFSSLCNYVVMNNSCQNALDRVTREIRQTKSLDAYAADALTFTDADGQPLQYTFDAANGQLVRLKGAARDVLCGNLVSCRFDMFQRNTADGSYDRIATTNVLTAKAIRLTFKLSVNSGPQRATTESAQSADVVIRNSL